MGDRVFLVPEVEWDDAEREWLSAWRWYQTEFLCPCGCGWPRSVTLDPMTEFNLEVAEPVRCKVTQRLVGAQKAWVDEHPGIDTAGQLWSARLRTPGDAGGVAQ